MSAYKFNPDPKRSDNMSKIRSKDTVPEKAVRKICRDLGYSGYRLHRKDLPGKPDITFISRKIAIFVHGCFWHGHDCHIGNRKPKTNLDYWFPKIEGNKQRDIENISALRDMGWRILVIWECETKNIEFLAAKIRYFLL